MGWTVIAGHFLVRGFQVAKGIADQCSAAGLRFGAAVQVTAQLGQHTTAAGDLLGVLADGPDQIHQIGAQAIQRCLNIVQLTVGRAELDVPTEVAFGPGRQRWREVGQYTGEASLQSVDQQRDQQNQADHHALHEPHLTLDLPMLSANGWFQPGDGLLHSSNFQVGGGAEVGAFLDLVAGAAELGGIAGQQAGKFTFEADAGIFGDRFFGVLQAHHRREIVGVRFFAGGHAKQRQGFDQLGLGADAADFTLDIGGQFTAATADQLVPGQREFTHVLRGCQQGWEIGSSRRRTGAGGVLAELLQAGAQFALGLEQQGLRIPRQFAGSQQIGLAELIEVGKAWAHAFSQIGRQLGELFLQRLDGLAGTAQA